MAEKIILVTSPDDTVSDGMRITLVNLSRAQRNLLSAELVKLNVSFSIIIYICNQTDDVIWLIDKTRKSQLIIFNADSLTHTINGYLSAQLNSHYFGSLQDLAVVNQNKIENCSELLQTYVLRHR